MNRAQLLRQEALLRLQTRMGAWLITRLLGLGGAGAVYLAHDGQRHGALKTLHASYQRDAKQRARFEREARVISELSHPNIVQIFEHGEDDRGDIFFVMEHLEGAPLEHMMRRYKNQLEPRQAVFVLRGLLQALEAVHARGVIHRDIKPQNLFITTNPTNVKLLDFGVAHDDLSTDQLTMHGAILGTPAFMSPEQARGRLDMLDERSDLYSCGALFFTMITGHPIHHARTAEEGLLLAATKPFHTTSTTLPSLLPPTLIAVVERALAWNPSRRYQNASEMLHALDEAWRADHTNASPPSRQDAHKAAAIAQHAAPSQTQEDSAHPTPDSVEQSRQESPLVQRLGQTFQAIERALDARRKYGQTHREFVEQLQRAFEALTHTLANHDGPIKLLIRPYSLDLPKEVAATIWEPTPPFDELPYNLFSAGLRAIEFDAALSLDEFTSFVTTLTRDPRHDLDLEDDLGMVLWEQNFRHITLHMVTSFRVGDLDTQRDFDQACQEALDSNLLRLQHLQATHMQRAQLLLAIGEDALNAMRSQLVQTPHSSQSPTSRTTQTLMTEELQRLRQAAAMPRGDLRARAPYMLARIHASQALPEPDHDRFSQGLRHAFVRMSRQADRAGFLAFYTQLVLSTATPEARHDLTQDLWSEPLLEQLFASYIEDPSSLGDQLDAVKTLLSCLDHRALRPVCHLYPVVQHSKVLVAPCFHYIRRHVAHAPEAIAELIVVVDLPHVGLLLDLLEELGSPSAIAAMRATLEHPAISPELLARQYLWSLSHAPEQAHLFLAKLLQDKDPAVRIRTLQKTREHPLDIPSLSSVLQAHFDPQRFSQRPYSERRLLFDLLLDHDLYAARDRAIEILQMHKLSGAINTSRQLAIEILSEVPASPALFAALEDAAKRRPWNPRSIQDAAQIALDDHRHHRQVKPS